MELCREGRSYTVDTLRALVAPDRELFLLVGTDMFLTLDSWYCADEIFRLATVCSIRRESDADATNRVRIKAEEYRSRYGARIRFLDADVIEISSSELRWRLLSDPAAAASMLDPRVLSYIQERGLYR